VPIGWGTGRSRASAGGAGRGDRSRPAPSPRVSSWKGFLLAFLTGVTSGCYVYVPVEGTPAQGQYIGLDLNDRGRVGLGQSLGPAASRIEGTIQVSSDTAYQVSVASVSYLNGQKSPWTGESLLIQKDFVRDVQGRSLSRSRSVLLGVAALVATGFAVSRGLKGGGNIPVDPPPPPPPPNSIRVVPGGW
jgi:hypothetical protein